MKRIYVAGPISPKGQHPDTSHLAIEYLYNVRALIKASVYLLHLGFAPFCPALDLHYFLADGKSISEKAIKDMSLAWLAASDAVYFIPRWETSVGTVAEKHQAEDLHIPVFDSMYDLCEFFEPEEKP